MYVTEAPATDDTVVLEPVQEPRSLEEKLRFPLFLALVAVVSGLIMFVIQNLSLFVPRITVQEQQAVEPTQSREVPMPSEVTPTDTQLLLCLRV